MDFAISSLVNCLDELIDFGLGYLSAGIHVLEGSIDEIADLVGIKALTFVGVEGIEYGIYGFFELLVCVWHDFQK